MYIKSTTNNYEEMVKQILVLYQKKELIILQKRLTKPKLKESVVCYAIKRSCSVCCKHAVQVGDRAYDSK